MTTIAGATIAGTTIAGATIAGATIAGPTIAAEAAAATARAPAPIAAAVAAGRALLGLADRNAPLVQRGAVHHVDGGERVFIVRKGHEPEAAAAARLPIGDDFGVGHLAELLKGRPQGLIRGAPGQAADKELLRHLRFSSLWAAESRRPLPAAPQRCASPWPCRRQIAGSAVRTAP